MTNPASNRRRVKNPPEKKHKLDIVVLVLYWFSLFYSSFSGKGIWKWWAQARLLRNVSSCLLYDPLWRPTWKISCLVILPLRPAQSYHHHYSTGSSTTPIWPFYSPRGNFNRHFTSTCLITVPANLARPKSLFFTSLVNYIYEALTYCERIAQEKGLAVKEHISGTDLR